MITHNEEFLEKLVRWILLIELRVE